MSAVRAAPVSTTAWTAAHARAVRALFATCGAAGVGAAPSAPDLAIVLTSLSGQFAWHAELLVDLLAAPEGTAADAPPAPGTDAALRILDELCAREEWSAIAVVLARVVVPRLCTGVAEARARVDARVDGPRARALTLIARDLADACERLEPLAERALVVPGAIEATSMRCAEVERALVDGGVATGLVATARSARRG